MQNNKVYRDEYYVRAVCRDPRFEDFYKEKESARIWHTSEIGFIGGVHISFDGEKIYNLFEYDRRRDPYFARRRTLLGGFLCMAAKRR